MSQRSPSRRRRVEHERDQHNSGLTPLLAQLWRADPTVLAAAFVDGEGETIDYFSSLEPYAAKLCAAQLVAWAGQLFARTSRLAAGTLYELEVWGEQRAVVLRRIDDDYGLAVVRRGHPEFRYLAEAMPRAITAFRREIVLPAPRWEPAAQPLHVETRPATGWSYAPCSFSVGSTRTEVSEVLGRFSSLSRRGNQWCFRVRTEHGEELTLVQGPGDQWQLRAF
ncbi:MAG: hypothetical protein MJD61_22710 [Proteobacteria bacterium]|nr:hypothetical protein [Pseudomonadota bacterium]